jgi:hypothetical protein
MDTEMDSQSCHGRAWIHLWHQRREGEYGARNRDGQQEVNDGTEKFEDTHVYLVCGAERYLSETQEIPKTLGYLTLPTGSSKTRVFGLLTV